MNMADIESESESSNGKESRVHESCEVQSHQDLNTNGAIRNLDELPVNDNHIQMETELTDPNENIEDNIACIDLKGAATTASVGFQCRRTKKRKNRNYRSKILDSSSSDNDSVSMKLGNTNNSVGHSETDTNLPTANSENHQCSKPDNKIEDTGIKSLSDKPNLEPSSGDMEINPNIEPNNTSDIETSTPSLYAEQKPSELESLADVTKIKNEQNISVSCSSSDRNPLPTSSAIAEENLSVLLPDSCPDNSGGIPESATVHKSDNSATPIDVDPMHTQPTSRSASNSVPADLTVPETADPVPPSRRRLRFLSRFLNSDTSSSNDETSGNETYQTASSEDRKKKTDETIKNHLHLIQSKNAPKQKWNCVQEILKREYGCSSKYQSSKVFSNSFYDSLHMPRRLERYAKLDYHTGCVNALNFNDTGTLLVSGSDDLDIAIWDWYRKKVAISYSSGHRDNIFQCKFMPLQGNTHIVSCARDGQVRLAELSPAGLKSTRKIAKHTKSAHKLALRSMCAYEILSAGQDAAVLSIDIRQEAPEKLVIVKDIRGSRVPLYGIDSHPTNQDQFCVAGQDEYIRVYDRRIISPFGPPVIKYCPTKLIEQKPRAEVTSAVYSNNGDAILASYKNEDIFLFDTSLSEGAEAIHNYSGHQNSSTVKGVNFLSPSSRYIISGSDCGNIFIWDRDTESIVNCVLGDENGVVNVLEPHPNMAALATAGLDSNVKVWMPTGLEDPSLSNLEKVVAGNIRLRVNESSADAFGLDSHMLRMLMDTIGSGGTSRIARRRRVVRPAAEEELEIASDTSSDSDTSGGEEEDFPRGIQCTSQ